MKRQKMKPGVPGVCRYCKCTEAFRCPEGCGWANGNATVCSTESCVKRHIERKFAKDLLPQFRGATMQNNKEAQA